MLAEQGAREICQSECVLDLSKSCRNKFGHDRLDRTRKRAEIEAESSDISSTRRVCPRRQLLDKSAFSVKKGVINFISSVH